jgi:hypothetical protein
MPKSSKKNENQTTVNSARQLLEVQDEGKRKKWQGRSCVILVPE